MTRRASIVIVLAMFASIVATAHAESLQQGLDAYRDNHIDQAEPVLSAVAADPNTSAADRAEALQALARIDWLVRDSTEAAAAAALTQTRTGDEACTTAALALRIFREAGVPATPLVAAERARSQCQTDHAEEMHTQLARTHMALAAHDPTHRRAELAAAASELNAVDAAGRTTPEISAAMFSLALARRDAPAALDAWRGYYWLTGAADAPQALSNYQGRVRTIFTSAFVPHATDRDAIALINMLIQAGFTEDARLFAEQTRLTARARDTREWRHAEAYFAFERTVQASTLRANREMAGGGRASWYQADINAAMDKLMQSAGLSGEPMTALAGEYGFYGVLGETSGYPSLHAGHLVQDEHLDVAQYGQYAQLRFIVIDNMLSNGFESWLWDGWAESGGWSGDDGIVQVRSAYTAGPLSALRRARPGPARDRFMARIDGAALGERAALTRDGIAVLPATGERLELKATDAIAAHVGGDDAAFIAEYWRATIQYSIELHEGRHALDKATGRQFSDQGLEFRAKLSQIALADYPRLGLANVVNSTIGDTPHGNANRQVMEGYRAWIRQHSAEIASYDASAPELCQLNRLSDAQIRAIARGLDPDAQS